MRGAYLAQDRYDLQHALKELAAEVVAASPAHETEVVWDVSCDRFARFASSGPTQSADRVVPRVQVRVRVEREGGLGEASAVSDTLDLGGAKAALERALQLAGHGAVEGAADTDGQQPIE